MSFFRHKTTGQKIISICLMVAVGVSLSLAVSRAQTWVMPGSPPPDNATIRPVGGIPPDNLGTIDPHRASQNLNLNKITRLVWIKANNLTALDVSAALGWGSSFGAQDATALSAISNTSVSTVYANHTGTNFALEVLSSANPALAVDARGAVQSESGIQFGTDIYDYLNL